MNETFDILVIGGGINGAGIVRDASGRNLKVCLVEKNTVGSATSSWSTKLIHGGLRYLENYEFRLVRESLKEREVIKKPNIIIFIIESMGREYWGELNKNRNIKNFKSFTPFLDSLSKHSLIFPNAFATSRKSIHAMPSVLAGVPSFEIAYTSSYYSRQKLQSLSAEHRDFIRNEIFIIEEEIWELKLDDGNKDRIKDLTSAKALLEQVDESINYKELIYKPTTILGYAANNGVIGSVLGFVLTGCLFAVQAFVSTGMEYDAAGWFNF